MGPHRDGVEPTVLLVGAGERFTPAFQAALSRYRVQVETTELAAVMDAVIVTAPDLVLLMGEAAKDGGVSVLTRLAGLSQNFTVPVVVLNDDTELDAKLSAFRHGATAVLPRSASVDATAEQVAKLARDLPGQGADSQGALGESTLDEFVAALSRQLRAGLVTSLAAGGDEAADLRLTLGRGRPLTEFLDTFVRRVRRHVVRAEPLEYELSVTSGGDALGPARASLPAAKREIAALRVVLADDETPRADAVAQELRSRGVTVVVTDLDPSPTRFQTLRQADPTVIVIGEDHAHGEGYDFLRRLRRDSRLRWGSLLVVRWGEVWSEERGAPTIGRLESTLAGLLEAERALLARADARVAFDTRLETTGPARLLRTLEKGNGALRVHVENPRVELTVDISDGLVVGAEGRTLELESRPLSGVHALSALLVLGSGRVRVEPVDQPASANVMTPVEAALNMADAETPPISPSIPAAGTVSLHPPGPAEAPAPAEALRGSLKPAPIVQVVGPVAPPRPGVPPTPLRAQPPRAVAPPPTATATATATSAGFPAAPLPPTTTTSTGFPAAPPPPPAFLGAPARPPKPGEGAGRPPMPTPVATPAAMMPPPGSLPSPGAMPIPPPGPPGPPGFALAAVTPVALSAAPLAESPLGTPHEPNPPAMTVPHSELSSVAELDAANGATADPWQARLRALAAWFAKHEAKLHAKRIPFRTTAVLVGFGALQGLLLVTLFAGARWLTRKAAAPESTVVAARVLDAPPAEKSAPPAAAAAAPVAPVAPVAARSSVASVAPEVAPGAGDGSGYDAPDCSVLLAGDTPHEGRYPGAALQQRRAGRTAIVRGDLKLAQTSLCRAARYDDANGAIALELALVLLLERDGPDALRWARRAVELGPKDWNAKDALGDALARVGSDAEARAAFIAAARLEPTNEPGVRALVNRALKLADHALRHGDLVTAERAFRRAQVLEPRSSSAASGLGYTLLQLGDVAPAVRWARHAVGLAPRSAGARLGLGDALAKSGDASGAAREWREAALLDPSSREAKKRLRAAGLPPT